jgi:hypothetical protein
MEFPKTHNVIWADGEDYVKLTISKNPLTSNTRFSGCFRTCITNKVPLKTGQKINIQAQDCIIYWGDERCVNF